MSCFLDADLTDESNPSAIGHGAAGGAGSRASAVATGGRIPLGGVIVGAGLMGRWHAHALARAGGRIAAVVDPSSDRAHAIATQYQGAATANHLAELLEQPRFDVAHICTPVETHVELARLAIAAGFHTLVEKPLTTDAVVAAELLRSAADRAVLLCPVHQFLFQRGFIRLQRVLPRIGPVRHLDYVACSAGAQHAPPDRRDSLALDILPHPLSLLVRLVPSPPSEISWHVTRPDAGELRISGTAPFGSVGLLISAAGRPTRNTLRVIGEHGTAHLDLFHGFCVIEGGAVSRTRKAARPFLLSGTTFWSGAANLLERAMRREPAYPGLREIIRRFYAAAATAGPPPIAPEEILEVERTRDLIRDLIREET